MNVERLRTVDDALAHWPLFREGLEHLNGLLKPEKRVKAEKFFSVVLNSIAKGDKLGHVAVYRVDERSEPIGFTIAHVFDDAYYDIKVVLVHAAYARKTVPGASRFALQHLEKWAKASGFQELQAFTPRINGKGFAIFEKRFGFKRHLVHFFKTL